MVLLSVTKTLRVVSTVFHKDKSTSRVVLTSKIQVGKELKDSIQELNYSLTSIPPFGEGCTETLIII